MKRSIRIKQETTEITKGESFRSEPPQARERNAHVLAMNKIKLPLPSDVEFHANIRLLVYRPRGVLNRAGRLFSTSERDSHAVPARSISEPLSNNSKKTLMKTKLTVTAFVGGWEMVGDASRFCFHLHQVGCTI